MIWLAIAIVIVGFIFANVWNKHHRKMEELRQEEIILKKVEIEANPEYRKKRALEHELKLYREEYEHHRENYDQTLEKRDAAKESGNKNEIDRWDKILEYDRKSLREVGDKIKKYSQELEGIKYE